MLFHPALCCRKETYSSASSDCSTDSTRSQSLKSLCQDVQSRTFAGWGWWASAAGGRPQLVVICKWWASATGGNPQLVVIRNWRASTTVKKQRSPRNGARLGRARGIDTWNSGLIVGEQGPAGWVFCFPSLTTPQGLKERTHDSGTLVRQSQAIRSYMPLTGDAAVHWFFQGSTQSYTSYKSR